MDVPPGRPAAEQETGRPAYRPFRVRVTRVERLSPAFWQVTFTGPDAADFGTEGLDQRVKLLLPDPDGASPRPPDLGIDDPAVVAAGDWYGRWLATPEPARPAMRTYTVRRARPAAHEVDVVLVEHPVAGGGRHGPAGRWLRAVTGSATTEDGRRARSAVDDVVIVGPDVRSAERGSGIDWRPGEATRLLLAGDETAAPAIVAILEATSDVPATAFVEVPSAADVLPADIGPNARITWLDRGADAHGSRLLPAVTAWLDSHDGLLEGAKAAAPQEVEDTDVDVELIWDSPEAPHRGFYAWIAGEAAAVKALRRAVVTDRGVDRTQVAFMGYWRLGQAERA